MPHSIATILGYGKNGEEYEILKTIKNTVIKKSSETNEETYNPYIDTIIRSLKKNDVDFACDVNLDFLAI